MAGFQCIPSAVTTPCMAHRKRSDHRSWCVPCCGVFLKGFNYNVPQLPGNYAGRKTSRTILDIVDRLEFIGYALNVAKAKPAIKRGTACAIAQEIIAGCEHFYGFRRFNMEGR